MQQEDNRVVVILVDNSVSVTGALKCAIQQAQLLQASHRYLLVLPQNSGAIEYVQQQGVAVRTLPLLEINRDWNSLIQYPFRLLTNTKNLLQVIRKERAQVLIVNDFYNLLGATCKLRMPHLRLFTFVRMQPAVMPAFLRRIWIWAGLRFSQKLIAVSQTIIRQLPAHPKVQLVYDGVHFSEQLPPFVVRDKPESIELLYLGNYIRGKGQDFAVRAFAAAIAENNKLRLSFMGGDMGLEKNRAFKMELIQYVDAQGLSNVVRFLPFERDVEKAYKDADIYLNFSEAESFSMTCAEAAFYGVPTIASRCGGPEEIIADGETGLLAANRSIPDFTAAILRLTDQELRRKFSGNSPVWVKQKFSPEQFTARLSALLQNN